MSDVREQEKRAADQRTANKLLEIVTTRLRAIGGNLQSVYEGSEVDAA